MKKIKRFYVWLFYEKLKLWYKPTQFYYTNTIQNDLKGRRNIGAGSVFLFCNRKSQLLDLHEFLNLPDSFRLSVEGYPCLKVKGGKIGMIKNVYKKVPMAEILRELKNQKTDKV